MTLRPSEYQLIVESSPNMVWRSGLDGLCDYFNKTWLDFTGRKLEEETGSGWAKGVYPDDLDYCMNTYLSAFNARKPFEMNYRLKRRDGEYRWINDRGVPVFEDGRFVGFIGSCMDITEKIEGQALKTMAEMDGVCGIFNRQYSYRLLEEKMKHPVNLCLVMLDIDDFKAINDVYGHLTGDKVLRHVSFLLSKHMRKEDILGRYGGDEFFCVLADTSVQAGISFCERLRTAIEKNPLALEDGTVLSVTTSIGVTSANAGEQPDDLINRADKALYRAKQKGKNSVCSI
jgi:diguanylate cyclase (GGDEF)-like protein/PAS domain S-box-containing protein